MAVQVWHGLTWPQLGEASDRWGCECRSHMPTHPRPTRFTILINTGASSRGNCWRAWGSAFPD